MPTYKVISEEYISDWTKVLVRTLLGEYKNPTRNGIIYIVLQLYEYFQVLCNFRLNNGLSCKSVSVIVKDIKLFINDKAFDYHINTLMNFRNDAGHGFVSDETFDDFICYLTSDDFKNLLLRLSLDSVLYSNLLNLLRRLKVCFTKEYSSHCIEECRNYLRPINGKSTYTVEDTVTLLKDKYDDVTINNALRVVLVNNYVTE